ncbi:MAG: type II toxin-antitoxin system RelE/ParE family toxin [Oscillospiraceae bacterium]|uniref:type II toxin-antitoxin system RelE/ParE family toxin n=1 Tax=Ruminococcus sp. TaxID=41978 RepID=UPI001B2C6F66|nr:type II toxin-antitoxin system RelE/ParE family toxin [Ruminococcus sp.]MBO6309283.1 type II toxin-antitoxin system RelE/ParE family toxin [Oribacterium sp.]MBQ9209511.1 type II toxin-antitoxin system RelE/ParE family toxin [Oscillospiraceae bacterium]MBR1431010.1 type II toxin-antitoxin system RelE/ParE family toxin [Ruminococcus sp.]
MKVIYTFKAQQDLHDIYEYIRFTLLSPAAAHNTLDRLMKAVRTLEQMPERNPLYKDEPWHSQGVRFVPVKNYLVFYTVNSETETVSVARIMYGGRNISDQLEQTNEW